MRKLSPFERAVNNPIVFLAIVLFFSVVTAITVKWADDQFQIGAISLF